MAIVVTLSPELEALLLDKAARRGQDVSLVASELLANVLEWEEQDSEEAIKGIQQGLDDCEAGQLRSLGLNPL
jgi:predicted transcriptional regulator